MGGGDNCGQGAVFDLNLTPVLDACPARFLRILCTCRQVVAGATLAHSFCNRRTPTPCHKPIFFSLPIKPLPLSIPCAALKVPSVPWMRRQGHARGARIGSLISITAMSC